MYLQTIESLTIFKVKKTQISNIQEKHLLSSTQECISSRTTIRGHLNITLVVSINQQKFKVMNIYFSAKN